MLHRSLNLRSVARPAREGVGGSNPQWSTTMTSQSCVLTHDYLLKKFIYDPETGVFSRRSSTYCRQVGFADKDGYLVVRLLGKRYPQHRLAWFYVTGEFPETDIDHIDGDRQNNKFDNLRVVTKAVNRQNIRRSMPCSKTGFLGAQVHHGKFRAVIHLDGKAIILGRFDTAEDAHAAYLNAKRQLHVGCTI